MNNISKRMGFTYLLLIIVMLQSCMFFNIKKQVRTGESDPFDRYCWSEREYSTEEMHFLSNSTTIFVLRDQDLSKKEEFEKAIRSVWTLTPIKIMPYDSIEKYKRGNYTFFIMDGSNTPDFNSSVHAHSFLGLNRYTYTTTKRGKEREERFNYGRIDIYAADMSVSFSGSVEGFYKKENLIKNWVPGMIKIYLSHLQNILKQSKREFGLENFAKKDEIKKLEKDTLYVPDYILDKVNRFTERETLTHNEDDLFSEYPYPYVFIDIEKLSNKIMKGEVEFVFEHIRDGTEKIVKVYSVKTGKIYQEHQSVSNNLKRKNINRIAKAIGKE